MTDDSNPKILWQTVVMRAVMDAAYTGSDKELTRERRDADNWLRSRGRDFHMVCNLAGMDPTFIADAYKAGRIDYARLSKWHEREAAAVVAAGEARA